MLESANRLLSACGQRYSYNRVLNRSAGVQPCVGWHREHFFAAGDAFGSAGARRSPSGVKSSPVDRGTHGLEVRVHQRVLRRGSMPLSNRHGGERLDADLGLWSRTGPHRQQWPTPCRIRRLVHQPVQHAGAPESPLMVKRRSSLSSARARKPPADSPLVAWDCKGLRTGAGPARPTADELSRNGSTPMSVPGA